jgi:hypothetical protein
MTAPYTIVFVPSAQWINPERGFVSNEQSPNITVEVIWLMSTIRNNLYTFSYAHSTEVSGSIVHYTYDFILFVSRVAFAVKVPHFRSIFSPFHVRLIHTLVPSFIHSTYLKERVSCSSSGSPRFKSLSRVDYIAWFQVSAAVQMKSATFWDFMHRRMVITDVSWQPISPVMVQGSSNYIIYA